MIYLASPYSHKDPALMQLRGLQTRTATGLLIRAGHHVISPIAYTTGLPYASELGHGWEAWAAFDEALLFMSDQMWVLQIDGWEQSVGLKAEVCCAREQHKPVRYLHPPPEDGNWEGWIQFKPSSLPW